MKIKHQDIEIHKEEPQYITEFSRTLLDGYYKRDGESIPEALARPAVAFCFGDYELAQRIYDYAYNGWFMYASPVLSNATKGRWLPDAEKAGDHYWYNSTFIPEEIPQGLPISCFAFDVPDTAKGQVEAVQELATLSMSGGGTGAHMSIRAVGGKAVGPIPYMKVMDSAIGYFRQGKTRKGAIAVYLDVDHPDITEHIRFRKPGGDTKRRSDNRQQMHGAINLTDKFIAAVKSGTDYDLICPHTKKIHETLKARAVWEEILETRALTGEPYLLKIDEANRRMPESQKAKGLKIRGSNLCVAPETMILTDKGHIEIASAVGSEVNVWNGFEWSAVTVQKTSDMSLLVKVSLSDGKSLDCTPEHKFYVAEGYTGRVREVRANDLQEGDKLIKFEVPVIQGEKTLSKAFENGFYSGDGCEVNGRARVYLYEEKRNLRHLFSDTSGEAIQDKQKREYFYVAGLERKFFVPDATYSVKSRVEWFTGLMDADGHVAKNAESQTLQIASVEPEFLERVQSMLQTLGVQSKVTFSREAGKYMLPANDGTGELKEYDCRKVQRLLITATGIVGLKKVGYAPNRLVLSDHTPDRECAAYVKVSSVECLGRLSPTYCFTEPKKHTGVFNGILTGQCSEIVLPTDEERTFVCCLSSLNIEKYEEWKDTSIVQDLVRFLDNVLQSFINNAPDTLKKAKYSAEKERAIGLGTLGWHGFLQSKGIPIEGGGFGSSVQWTHVIYSMIAKRAEDESRKLATERGEPDDMVGTGLRNSRRMAIAPNANSADLLDTSPSIEPYFRNVFLKDTRAGTFKVKNRHLQKVLVGLGKDTEDVWTSIDKNSGSVSHLEFLSDEQRKVFATSMELDQHWLVELAEQRGKHVDQAQSLNLFFPYGSSKEYVNSVHLKYLDSENVLTLYYFRTEREVKADTVKAIERKALVDWKGEDCVACSG